MKPARILGAISISLASSVSFVAWANADELPTKNQHAEVAHPAAAATETADQVAARVQAFYDQAPAFESRFFQTYFNKLYNNYQRSQGHVVFKKPGKMFWHYDEPNGKIIVSEGSHILVYEPGDPTDLENPHSPREPGQVIEIPMQHSELAAALSFLTGTGRLADEFTFRLLDAAAQGFAEGQVLELTPKHANPNYDRVLFFITRVGSGARVAAIVSRVLILDHAGNRNRFDFQEMNYVNPHVDEATFHWQPPAGTRHIQP